jgi:hypothetical protein
MAMNLRRKTNRTKDFEAKTRITYVLETNKKVIDTTVIGYVTPRPKYLLRAPEAMCSRACRRTLKRDQEDLVR